MLKQYKMLKNVVEQYLEEYILYFTRGPYKTVYNKPVPSECAAIIISKDGMIPNFDYVFILLSVKKVYCY